MSRSRTCKETQQFISGWHPRRTRLKSPREASKMFQLQLKEAQTAARDQNTWPNASSLAAQDERPRSLQRPAAFPDSLVLGSEGEEGAQNGRFPAMTFRKALFLNGLEVESGQTIWVSPWTLHLRSCCAAAHTKPKWNCRNPNVRLTRSLHLIIGLFVSTIKLEESKRFRSIDPSAPNPPTFQTS